MDNGGALAAPPLSRKGDPMTGNVATPRLIARALTIVAVALYVATLVLPFVHGTIRLLVSFSKDLTLLEFMKRMADKQPGAITGMVAFVVVALPLALLGTALLVSWAPWRVVPRWLRALGPRLRLGAWGVAALGVVFMIGMCAASSATGGPKLRLLPGGWCFCASLAVAAAAVMLAVPSSGDVGEA